MCNIKGEYSINEKKIIIPILLVIVVIIGAFVYHNAKNKTPANPNATNEITDMAGRTVTVPEKIDSVYSTNPASAIYIYTLEPDKLLGWNYELNDLEKSIILKKYHSLPNFGMGDVVNYEAVIEAKPTIAINAGVINDATKSECDTLQEKLGIPVIAVDADLSKVPDAYRFMGKVFHDEKKAEKLAKYAELTLDDISEVKVNDKKKIKVYYGNEKDSLETAPKKSPHGKIIELANRINVADLEFGNGGRVKISAEQLLAWDPDVIILNGEPKANMSGYSAADALKKNPVFANLKVVKNDRVYGTPNAPFSWLDRPNASNRIVGLRWLTAKLYPNEIKYDVDKEVKKFYDLFYHVKLSDKQLANLYEGKVENDK